LVFQCNAVTAFSPKASPLVVGASETMLRRHLHPNQAADLEACAYDLMKEALQQEQIGGSIRSRSNSSSSISVHEGMVVDPNTMQQVRSGPVAWCRRRLWPFARNTIQQQGQEARP